MRAITVIPGQPDSAELTELPEPQAKEGEVLVEPLFLGARSSTGSTASHRRAMSGWCSATSCSAG
jgi:hypothetical protein